MGTVKRYTRVRQETIQELIGVASSEKVNELLSRCEEEFDIDKSWEVIHYLITGHKAYFGDHPFSIILNPENVTFEISEAEDDFYWEEVASKDPLSIEKWKRIDEKINAQIAYLDNVDIKVLYQLMEEVDINKRIEDTDFEKLNQVGIYPENWTNSKDQKEYVEYHFSNLKLFLKRALDNGNYIIVH